MQALEVIITVSFISYQKGSSSEPNELPLDAPLGLSWYNHRIISYYNNQAVVAFIRSCTSKHPHCMHMLRTSAFLEARHSFIMHAAYIDTRANHLAVVLSRKCSLLLLPKGPTSRRSTHTTTCTVHSPAPGSSHGLDLSTLASVVQWYFQAGLASSFQRAYDSGLKRFNAFCTKYNMWETFPITEHRLCCFAAYLSSDGLAPTTVRSYLSVVHSMQISLAFPDPKDQS